MSSIGSNPQPKHIAARSAQWWLTVAVALIAAVCGFWGQWWWEEEHHHHPNVASIAYHTLQLFILHAPHLEEPVRWPLQVGRWAGSIALILAILTWLRTFFLECHLAMTKWEGGHVIVCGLGRMGTQLALGFRRANQRVVAIEEDSHRGGIAKATDAGVLVIHGDPADPASLKRAGLADASKIVLVCDDEQKNVAVAAVAGRLVKDEKSSRESWMFFENPHLRRGFQMQPVFSTRLGLQIGGLDPFESTARQVLKAVPLDFRPIASTDSTQVHLVFVGFGRIGQQLVLQAARIGHFANFQKLRITVLERKGSSRVAGFLGRTPKFEGNFKGLCDFQEILLDLPGGDPDPAAVASHLPAAGNGDLTTVIVCWDTSNDAPIKGSYEQALEQDDGANLSVALAVAAKMDRSQVLMFQTRKDGFARAFSDASGSPAGQRIFPFGMPEEIWSIETLLHEKQDEVAKALHEDWLGIQFEKNRKVGDRPALYFWPELGDHFKDANRRAADHIDVKLRAIGCDTRPWSDGHEFEFSEAEVDLLARMEHESWWAEWLLRGYTDGPEPQDDVAMTKPSMIPWGELSRDIQQYDRDQVLAIPQALKKIGLGLYRRGS